MVSIKFGPKMRWESYEFWHWLYSVHCTVYTWLDVCKFNGKAVQIVREVTTWSMWTNRPSPHGHVYRSQTEVKNQSAITSGSLTNPAFDLPSFHHIMTSSLILYKQASR